MFSHVIFFLQRRIIIHVFDAWIVPASITLNGRIHYLGLYLGEHTRTFFSKAQWVYHRTILKKICTTNILIQECTTWQLTTWDDRSSVYNITLYKPAPLPFLLLPICCCVVYFKTSSSAHLVYMGSSSAIQNIVTHFVTHFVHFYLISIHHE